MKLSCACKEVTLEVEGAPILTAECCCTSCRAAAAVFAKKEGSPQILTDLGGTPFVLYRKDRVRCTSGQEHVKEFRLSKEAKTRRMLATCCNTPLFLEFQGGHWLSMYAALWPTDTRPKMQMRSMTSDLPAGTQPPSDIPNAKTQSASFMFKLLGAWIAMGFRAPKLTYVNGSVA